MSDYIIKALCIIGVFVMLAVEGIIASRMKEPVLPMTYRDKCMASGVAMSPTSGSTMRRNTSYVELTSVQSV